MVLSISIITLILQAGGAPTPVQPTKQARVTDSQKDKNLTWKAFLDRTFSKESGALAIEIPANSIPVLATSGVHSLARLTAVYNWDVLDKEGATLFAINQAKEWGTTGQQVLAFCSEIKNLSQDQLASLASGEMSIESLPPKAKQFVMDYCVKNSEGMRESYLRGDDVSLMLGQAVDAKVKNLETGETQKFRFSGMGLSSRFTNGTTAQRLRKSEPSGPIKVGKQGENGEFIFSEGEVISLDQLNMNLFIAKKGTVQYDKRFGKVQVYLRGKFKTNQLQEAMIAIATGLPPTPRPNGASISEAALNDLQDRLASLMDDQPIEGSSKKLKDLRGAAMTLREASAMSASLLNQTKGKGIDSNSPVEFGFRLMLQVSGQGTAKDSFGNNVIAGMGIILGG